MIQKLTLKYFRNHSQLDLSFQKPFVYIYGPNGVGKTSILESIYFLATTKSHRTHQERELIQKDQPFTQVKMKVGQDNYEIVMTKDGKRAKINQIEKRKISDFVGNLQVVMFAPSDLDLIQGSPSVRRHFLDFEILQRDKQYLHDLTHYKQILKQRNALLKRLKIDDDPTFLNILGQQLYEVGVKLLQKRKMFCESLNELFKKSYQTFSQHDVQLLYQPDVDEQKFKKHLETQQKQDIYYQTTLAGPHRDDFLITFKGFDSKSYASTGETRLIVVALKLALLKWIEKQTEQPVILLLDDVLSELDEKIQNQFLQALPKNHQILMNGVQKIQLEDVQMIELTKGV
ncbi:MAG: DNA replication/repair protein RecF [Acholeplasmataceae bacterium]